MKYPLLSFLIITSFLIRGCTANHGSRIIGVKIYEYSGNAEKLATKWGEMGVNTAFVSTTLASDSMFRRALKERSIKVFIIFPVFQNPEILKSDSSLFAISARGLPARNDWVNFVCPSRITYRENKLSELDSLIRKLEPDGVSIDFIRHFVYWEMIYPGQDPALIDRTCYCDSCIAGFIDYSGIRIPDTCRSIMEKGHWIDANCPEEWTGYRCDLITTMVRDLSELARRIRPGIIVNVHAVPWRETDFANAGIRVAGQDLKAISPYADLLSPMCYSQMVKRSPGWISEVVKDMDRKAAGKILPSIQVYPYYTDKPFTNEDFRKSINEALKTPSRGVVFFSWPLFVRDSSRIDDVKAILGRISSK